MYQVAVNRPLQVPCAVFPIGSLQQKEIPRRSGYVKHEGRCIGGTEDPLLHHVQLERQNLAQLSIAQWLEDNRFVDAVDELGRELAPRGFQTSARNAADQRF